MTYTKKLYTKGKGIHQQAPESDFALDMTNLDIDGDTGFPVLRKGIKADDSPVLSNNGGQLFKADGKIYAINERESWIDSKGRIIISGKDTAARIIDKRRNETFKWEITTPDKNIATGVFGAVPIGVNDEDTREWKFGLCYTYTNDEWGVESSPSSVTPLMITTPTNRDGLSSVEITWRLELFGTPDWATGINYYIQRVPDGGVDYRRPYASDGETRGPARNDSGVSLRAGPDGSIIYVTPSGRGTDADGNIIYQTVKELQDNGADFVRIRAFSFPAGGSSIEGFHEQSVRVGLTFADGDVGVSDKVPSISENSYGSTLPAVWSAPPPDDLEHITQYAGRVWGYSEEHNSICFSFIDGFGKSAIDFFPIEDVPIPHALSTDGNRPTAISVMPGKGGLYVFFANEIRTITGQALISGLHSLSIAPRTDLDFSGGIPNFGTQSPHSIVNFRSSTVFLGTDKHIWQLIGTVPKDIGTPIQKDLDRLNDSNISSVFAFNFEDRYHIVFGSRVYVYDVSKGYWTSYDIEMDGAYWSRDGESILYGVNDGVLFRAYYGLDDLGADIDWSITSQQVSLGTFGRAISFTVNTVDTDIPIDYQILMDGEVVQDDSFTPNYRNGFTEGIRGAEGSQFQLVLSGTEYTPRINQISVEYAA